MPLELTFPKSGAEIREAIGRRLEQLQARLTRRSRQLDELMDDRQRLRSYLIRSIEQPWVHNVRPGTSVHLASPTDISSEERDEIRQLCRRLNEIEQEIKRLTLIRAHLKGDQIFQPPYDDLVLYGFDAGFEVD
jgi:DNA repair exonuclease SbcCD ATPase subunit